MFGNETLEWNRETIRSLRLRLGWSKSDLARRLKCSSAEVEAWEEGGQSLSPHFKGELEMLYFQAEACCDEVQFTPVAEAELDKKSLDQIPFSRLKE